MSSKIAAITHPVKNFSSLLVRNLHLPIESDIDGFISLEGYMPDWGFSFCPPFNTLLSNMAICYFHYFYKDSPLRIQYFDTIRAMGLREMWVMGEEILDYCKDEDVTIDDFLRSVETSLHINPQEFSEYKFETYDNGYGYKFPTNYAYLYHDDFKDLFDKVNIIEAAFNVQVVGLNENPRNCIKVIKDNQLMHFDFTKNEIVEIRN